MRSAILYHALAPIYGRVVAPLQELAVARAAERTLGGWPGSVLEVGVGPGVGLVRLSHPTRRAVGVDLSPQMLRMAAARLSAEHMHASLARASVLQLPFASNEFEAVLSMGLLDLLPEADISVAIEELARVATGGARLVLGIMELPNRVIQRAWMVAYRAVPELTGRCRPVQLERYLPKRGLRIIRDEHVPGVIGTRLVTLVKAAG